MATVRGYRAKYDYVELIVERREDHWRLVLEDARHAENVEHEETFATPADAQSAALTLAEHHINIQHNDTLPSRPILTWRLF
jgi:hypothetical protein